MAATLKQKHASSLVKSPKRSLKPDFSALAQSERDFKDAVLTVSVFVNLFMLCIWIALQTTSAYDQALANFFIGR